MCMHMHTRAHRHTHTQGASEGKLVKLPALEQLVPTLIGRGHTNLELGNSQRPACPDPSTEMLLAPALGLPSHLDKVSHSQGLSLV